MKINKQLLVNAQVKEQIKIKILNHLLRNEKGEYFATNLSTKQKQYLEDKRIRKIILIATIIKNEQKLTNSVSFFLEDWGKKLNKPKEIRKNELLTIKINEIEKTKYLHMRI